MKSLCSGPNRGTVSTLPLVRWRSTRSTTRPPLMQAEGVVVQLEVVIDPQVPKANKNPFEDEPTGFHVVTPRTTC